mmetsp:Transcript_42874/g.103584  ORF Transcript_42874/g.103584 Transcript_42874/m.103584 type:complete len:459 (-) Transcript_42874:3177-4553(-)
MILYSHPWSVIHPSSSHCEQWIGSIPWIGQRGVVCSYYRSYCSIFYTVPGGQSTRNFSATLGFLSVTVNGVDRIMSMPPAATILGSHDNQHAEQQAQSQNSGINDNETMLVTPPLSIPAFAAASSAGGGTGGGVGGTVFNGGKMEHIFEFAKSPGSKGMVYGPNFSSPAAQEALENTSNVFWKIDGACGMLKFVANSDNTHEGDGEKRSGRGLELYERQDTRGKDPTPDLIPLPACYVDKHSNDSENINSYQENGNSNMICKNDSAYGDSKGRGHTYYMKKIQLEDTDGKKQRKMKSSLLQVLDDNSDDLIDAVRKYGTTDGYLSVELIGKKFQKTPGVDVDAAIAIHCEQRLDLVAVPKATAAAAGGTEEGIDVLDKDIEELTVKIQDMKNQMITLPRTFDGMKDFLLSRNVEGAVLEHNGTFWKIRSSLMDVDCLFEKDRSNAIPPAKFYTPKTTK